MSVLVAIILIGLLACALFLYVSAHARRHEQKEWYVTSSTRQDGTMLVGIRGPDGDRLVRELSPLLEGPELKAELRRAREEAAAQADELNRASAARRRS